jgi:AraC-like DNA-binding protein
MPVGHVRTLYIQAARPPSRFRRPGDSIPVLECGPLLRAVVDHIHQHGADSHLIAVLFDQLAAQRELPLFLPVVSAPIAKRVAEVLTAHPSDQLRIRDLAGELGKSARTLERAFAADVGMPLGEWRQRARISRAIALLAGGMDVKDVALEVGYETPSAFVVAFKRYVGKTPGKLLPD